ncbi:MAG: DUF2288 domain-containing protein [Pseudomonadales bacterium]|nr:DUF2288 domain-containing protein [Pseudomonadales bacterium]
MSEEISDSDVLRAKLNAETAEISWMELQRPHAAGNVIQVSATLDLVEVGAHFVTDNSAKIQTWTTAGDIQPVTDTQAAAWVVVNQTLWALVISPWVLVQDKQEDENKSE